MKFSLYTLFFKIGAILIGGGYVVLPILKKELVDDKNLLTEDELVDYYALSQSLPGLIAINVSIFIGYKISGLIGALLSVLGMITVPFLCIITIASIVASLIDSGLVKSILWGVEFGVVILVISSVMEMWKKSVVDLISFSLFVIYTILILFFKINPAVLIILAVIIGLLLNRGRVDDTV